LNADVSRLLADLGQVLSRVSVWVLIGFLGQAVFTARFLVQWVASEKKRDSVMPVAFWWLSLAGGLILLSYVIHRRDPVLIVGQGMGLVVYIRNLMLVERSKRKAAKRASRLKAESGHQASGPRPHRVDAERRSVPWS
jgi:lipid-A-disaccharide synthase-like uncharacterized protein